MSSDGSGCQQCRNMRDLTEPSFTPSVITILLGLLVIGSSSITNSSEQKSSPSAQGFPVMRELLVMRRSGE